MTPTLRGGAPPVECKAEAGPLIPRAHRVFSGIVDYTLALEQRDFTLYLDVLSGRGSDYVEEEKYAERQAGDELDRLVAGWVLGWREDEDAAERMLV